MKRLITLSLLFIGFFAQAQVGVGTTTPDPNAQLDIVSTDKGVLLTRLDQTQADALAGGLTSADNGLMIYNTDELCLQIWKDTKFECVFVTSGAEAGNAGVVKVNVRGAGNQTASAAANAGDDTHPGYLAWGPASGGTNDYGDLLKFDFDGSDLVFSSFPTTNWPENASDTTITGIFTDNETFTSETGDAWIENPTPGQVHFWRVVMYVQSQSTVSDEGNIQLTIRNPQSGFSTSTTSFSPILQGVFEVSFILTTIADGVSLPAPTGTGLGYIIEATSGNTAIQEAWVDSITRISIFAD